MTTVPYPLASGQLLVSLCTYSSVWECESTLTVPLVSAASMPSWMRVSQDSPRMTSLSRILSSLGGKSSGCTPYSSSLQYVSAFKDRGRPRSVTPTSYEGMITITFIMACIVSVFFGKGVRGDILVLPVATLFAFTQLRGTMPGAPNGFGEC